MASKLAATAGSPTWGAVQRLASVVLEKLGGPAEAAKTLSDESFYTLSVLASLNLNEDQQAAYVLGRKKTELS